MPTQQLPPVYVNNGTIAVGPLGALAITGAGATLTETSPGKAALVISGQPANPVTVVPTTAPLILNGNSAVPATFTTGTALEIVGAPGTPSVIGNTAAGAATVYSGRRGNGTVAAPTQTKAGDTLLRIQAMGHTGTAYTGQMTSVALVANEDTTPTAQGSRLVFNTIKNGTTTVVVRATLSDEGILLIGTTVAAGTDLLQVASATLGRAHVGTNTGPTVSQGAGAPGTTEPAGSLYLRNNGSVGARIYINQDGASAWAAIPLV